MPDTGELEALPVRIAQPWDQGVVPELQGRAVERLEAAGFTDATLLVLTINSRARRFYGLAGWSPDGGEQLTAIGGADLAELGYRVVLPTGDQADPSVTSRG